MSSYGKNVDRLISLMGKKQGQNSGQQSFRELLNQLKMSHKSIAEQQIKNVVKSKTYQLVGKMIQVNSNLWYQHFKQLLQLLYLKESPLLKILYEHLPAILRMYIQAKESKNSGIQSVAKVIQSNEISNYNRCMKDKQQIRNNPFVKDLYSIHFNSKLEDLVAQEEEKGIIEEGLLSSSSNLGAPGALTADRQLTKIIILYVIYREIDSLSHNSLKQYLKAIYLYCGGELKDYINISSFYLLQKKNLFNPFKYSISEGQIEWMLLTLYELSIGSSRDRFQLLAAINMIYKKTANESMFRYSQIAQSIIHILEDQYLQIFS